MPSGARLWWVQHGSPQGVAKETAACTWPCETGRRCSSTGGIIVDNGATVSESQQEAETVFSQSLCTTASSSGNYNPGFSSSGSNSASYTPPQQQQPPSNSGSSSSNGNGATFAGAGSGSGNAGGIGPINGFGGSPIGPLAGTLIFFFVKEWKT